MYLEQSFSAWTYLDITVMCQMLIHLMELLLDMQISRPCLVILPHGCAVPGSECVESLH